MTQDLTQLSFRELCHLIKSASNQFHFFDLASASNPDLILILEAYDMIADHAHEAEKLLHIPSRPTLPTR